MTIYKLDNNTPVVDPSAYITDSANIIGKILIKKDVSIWFYATLRGDNELIEIGDYSNIQENSILHTDKGFPLNVGKYVTIGHGVILHGCSISDNCLIGIKTVILNGAKIGKNCIVGAGSLITEGKEFPDNCLILGAPAKIIRPIQKEQINFIKDSAKNYVKKSKHFLRKLKKIHEG
tara:strand:- start:139 stop:669 length:531 start_codon:yes stop_codon:yes gene_type:complete